MGGLGRRSGELGRTSPLHPEGGAGRGPGHGAPRGEPRAQGGGRAHQPGARAARDVLIQRPHGCPVVFVVVILFLPPLGLVGHGVTVHLGRVERPALGKGLPFCGGCARVVPGMRVPGVPGLTDLPPHAVSPGFRIVVHLGAAPRPRLGLVIRGRGRM